MQPSLEIVPVSSAPMLLHLQQVTADPSTPPKPTGRTVYLQDIHSFRALAILFIVAGHCLSLFNWHHAHSHSGWFFSLMPNGTVFFVFIAGFLFQHLSGTFEYRAYMKKKLRNVLLPYIFLSLPILFLQWEFTNGGTFNPSYTHHSPNVAWNVLWSLLTGVHTVGPFWFIPMIALFYLFAPRFLWLDRDGRIYRLLPLLLAAMVFVHRPADMDHIWHSCAYFVPVYIYGMWFSRNRERALAAHERWLPVLLTLLAALTWFEVAWLKRAGFIVSAGMFSTERGILDTNGIQKLLLCGILLVILRRFDRVLSPTLRYLADLSFGIYFLHMVFINGYLFAIGPVTPASSLWGFGFAVGAILALCIASLWLARQLFGSWSRSVVGC